MALLPWNTEFLLRFLRTDEASIDRVFHVYEAFLVVLQERRTTYHMAKTTSLFGESYIEQRRRIFASASPALSWMQCSYRRSLSSSTHFARLGNSVSAGYFRTVKTLMLVDFSDAVCLILTMSIDSLVTVTLNKNDEIKHFCPPLWICMWLKSRSSPSTAGWLNWNPWWLQLSPMIQVRCDASYIFLRVLGKFGALN